MTEYFKMIVSSKRIIMLFSYTMTNKLMRNYALEICEIKM